MNYKKWHEFRTGQQGYTGIGEAHKTMNYSKSFVQF